MSLSFARIVHTDALLSPRSMCMLARIQQLKRLFEWKKCIWKFIYPRVFYLIHTLVRFSISMLVTSDTFSNGIYYAMKTMRMIMAFCGFSPNVLLFSRNKYIYWRVGYTIAAAISKNKYFHHVLKNLNKIEDQIHSCFSELIKNQFDLY